MAVKAYGTYYSPNVNRALVVLHEKVVDFELVSVSILDGEQKKPEYLAIQPLGLVPLLQDGGFKLSESRAIMRYVADKYEGQGTPKLHGTTLEERAQVEQWLEIENGSFSPTVQTLIKEHLFKAAFFKKPSDPTVIEDATAKLAKLLDIYEAHLATHKYLAGDFVSLADLAHIPMAYILFEVAGKRELLGSRKHVAAWFEDVSARPAWKKVVHFATPDWEGWKKAAKSYNSSS